MPLRRRSFQFTALTDCGSTFVFDVRQVVLLMNGSIYWLFRNFCGLRGMLDKKMEDKKMEDKKMEDKKMDDKKMDDKKMEDKKMDDKKMEDKKMTWPM